MGDIETVSEVPHGCCSAPFHNGRIIRLCFHSNAHCTIILPDETQHDIKVFAPKRLFRGTTLWGELYQDINGTFFCDVFDMTSYAGSAVESVMCERIPHMIDVLNGIKCINEDPPVRIQAKQFNFGPPSGECLIFGMRETDVNYKLYCPLPKVHLMVRVREKSCDLPADVAKLQDTHEFRLMTADGHDVSEAIGHHSVILEANNIHLPQEDHCYMFLLDRNTESSVTFHMRRPVLHVPDNMDRIMGILSTQ